MSIRWSGVHGGPWLDDCLGIAPRLGQNEQDNRSAGHPGAPNQHGREYEKTLGGAELCRCPWRSFASNARSFGGARRADGPVVCSTVSVLFHPTSGVALKPPKPDHRVAGLKLRALRLIECGAAGLPVSRFRYVFGEFAGGPDHGEIQPA